MSSKDFKVSKNVHSGKKFYTFSTYKKETFHYTWVIDKFSKQLTKYSNGEFIKSNSFGGKNNDLIYIQLYPNGYFNANDYISIFLYCSDSIIITMLNIYILTKNGDKMFDERGFNEGIKGGLGWDYYLRCSKLLENKFEYLPNDQLTIAFEVEIELPFSLRRNFSGIKSKRIKSPVTSFNKKLLDSSKLSDFSIQIGDKPLKVHRSVLAAASPVFEAMFDTNTIENQQNSVNIVDIDYDVMKSAIHFIYTGECPKLNEKATKLLEVADKYEFQDLKNVCEDKLCSKMCVQNAADYLILADQHNATNLKRVAMSYIKDNIAEIMQSKEWKTIKMPDYLLKDIIEATNNPA